MSLAYFSILNKNGNVPLKGLDKKLMIAWLLCRGFYRGRRLVVVLVNVGGGFFHERYNYHP